MQILAQPNSIRKTESSPTTVFGRPFVKQFALCYRSVVLSVCLSVCLPVTLVYCGQTVGLIKMKLGMQVGLCPGHIVLGGDPAAPPQRGTASPNFRPISVTAKCVHGTFVLIFLCGECHPTLSWPNGWMDEDATWYGSRHRRGPQCIHGFPSLCERGTAPSPSIWPMSIMWPRSPISATAELLFYCPARDSVVVISYVYIN